MTNPTKDMSPFGAALFNCNRDPNTQLEALGKLREDVILGAHTVKKVPNSCMDGFSVRQAMGECNQHNED